MCVLIVIAIYAYTDSNCTPLNIIIQSKHFDHQIIELALQIHLYNICSINHSRNVFRTSRKHCISIILSCSVISHNIFIYLSKLNERLMIIR